MRPRWNELLALFLAAGASLLYQVTLTAMFGLGFSGVLLTRFPGLLKFRERGYLTVTCLLTAVGMVLGFLAVNHVPIHLPDAPNGWPNELINVSIVFLALAVPFVFFGLLISYLLEKRAQYANIYYFADLVGAGLGCFALVPLIPIWEPQGLVLFCVVATLAATVLFMGPKGAVPALLVMIAACLLPMKATEWFPLNVHVDKRESASRRTPTAPCRASTSPSSTRNANASGSPAASTKATCASSPATSTSCAATTKTNTTKPPATATCASFRTCPNATIW